MGTKESGAWLHVFTGFEAGDDTSLRIAVGLRLGSAICGPHSCHHCEFLQRLRRGRSKSMLVSRIFIPVAVETLGAFSPHSLDFKDLGRRIQDQPGRGDLGNFCSRDYLLQCRGGTASLSWEGWVYDSN